jgi:hypothetical protein
MADVPADAPPPSLQQQTTALGTLLKSVADNDPAGMPSAQAAAAFAAWLIEAGPGSREPTYFADVADNYDAQANSNRDLWDLFDILENYIEVEDEEPLSDTRRTFIGLPLAPEGGGNKPASG